jgi:hypothetical protein
MNLRTEWSRASSPRWPDAISSRMPLIGGERSWRRLGQAGNESSPRWRLRSARPQGSLDRSFHAVEEGRLREEVSTRRIEELSAELTSLEARRSELAEEVSESQPSVPDPRSSTSSSRTSSGP